jgi:hypothetical protein
MNLQELTDGLTALGFSTGYAAKDSKENKPAQIILWENEAKQPTYKEIQDAVSLGKYNRELLEVKQARHNAYIAPGGSDAVFLKYQRGEATKQEWLDAVQAINDAHPYPTK